MISIFFRSSYSFWLYYLLLTYFTVFYYSQIIYVQWNILSLPFAFAFNFFWSMHLLLFSVPLIALKLFKVSKRKRLKIKSGVAWFVTVFTTFPVFLFYKYYQGPPNATVAGQVTDPDFLKTTLSYFLDFYNLFFYFMVPALIVYGFYYFVGRKDSTIKNSRVVISLVVCVLLALLGKEAIQKGIKTKIYVAEMSPYHPIYYMYVANNNPFKVRKHSFGQGAKVNMGEKELAYAQNYLNSNFINGLNRKMSSASYIRTELSKRLGDLQGIKPNIVVLFMESLSTFHMEKEVMPFLTSFTESYPKSVVFQNFLGSSDQTVKGQHAFFCGQYVTPLGKISSDYLDLKIRCLSHILQEELGYTSAVFNGVNSSFHNKHHYFEKILNFDKMMGVEHLPREFFVPAAWGTSDYSALKYTLHQMEELRAPFLLHFMSVNFHGPFKLPEDENELVLDREKMKDWPLPIQILHYDDAALKSFFAKASKLKDYEKTIFIITADTGGGFSRRKSLSSYDLFEIRNKMPLIIHSPLFKKLRKPLVVSDLLSQYSVAPLLLDIMGYRTDNSFIGIPKTFYKSKSKLTERNSYVRARFGNIAKVFSMQHSFFEDNRLLISSGFNKFYADLSSLEKGKFANDMSAAHKQQLNRGFTVANDLWRKVYMPMLHFNRLLGH